METARALLRRDIAALPPAPAPVPAAEYVLIGPAGSSLEELAQLFAGLEHGVPAVERSGEPERTQEVPTIRIRVWNQPDGRRRVEVQDHQGDRASLIFRRASLSGR